MALTGFLFLLPFFFSAKEIKVTTESKNVACSEGTKSVKAQIKEFKEIPEIGVSQVLILEDGFEKAFVEITNYKGEVFDSVVIIVNGASNRVFVGIVYKGCILSTAVESFEIVQLYLKAIGINLEPIRKS